MLTPGEGVPFNWLPPAIMAASVLVSLAALVVAGPSMLAGRRAMLARKTAGDHEWWRSFE